MPERGVLRRRAVALIQCSGLAVLGWLCATLGSWSLRPVLAADVCTGVNVMAAGVLRCLHPGDSFKDCDLCPELVLVPPGEFLMGSPDEEAGHTIEEAPRHKVRIGNPLAIAKFEATFDEWDACVAGGGCLHKPRDPGWGRGKHPVINVSWDDAVNEYLPWLSRRSGHDYRLLSEAEWEYAARAGTSSPFFTGETISTKDANFDGTSTYGSGEKGEYRKRTLEAGTFAANRFGLHDMHGNVWEWVQDCHTATYADAPADGRPGVETEGCQRVMRGGSWIDSPRVIRSAARGHVPPNTRFIYRGFRVARTL